MPASPPNASNSWWRTLKALDHRAPADDGETQLARDPIDRRDRDQDHDDGECDLIEIIGSDLFGQLQADAASADDTDDRRRPDVGLDVIEDLSRDDRERLRQQTKADCQQACAAACQHRFPGALFGGSDRFRKQLAERAGIGDRDGENPREWPEADDPDEDQRPDQGVDAADGIEAAAYGEANDTVRRGIFRSEKADRKRN